MCWTENLQLLLSLIRTCYSSIIVPVDVFDVKRLANTDTADPLTTKTNCCERKMLFAWLWCPCRGPLKYPPITMWTTQCSSGYSPFHFYWSDVENPLEKKLTALKKSTTATLRWETGLVDIDSNRLCTLRLLHIFASDTRKRARRLRPSAGPPAFRKVQHQPRLTAAAPLKRQKHQSVTDSMKSLYSQSVLWFHFCSKLTDCNLSKIACSEAHRWGF